MVKQVTAQGLPVVEVKRRTSAFRTHQTPGGRKGRQNAWIYTLDRRGPSVKRDLRQGCDKTQGFVLWAK
jgi:hypothetical protein